MLFFFMCRFTCSRCWKTAVRLGRLYGQLNALGVAVVLIGDKEYLKPALKLATELRLPYPIYGDKRGAIRQYYLSGGEPPAGARGGHLLLVDRCGKVRFRRDGLEQEERFINQVQTELGGVSPS